MDTPSMKRAEREKGSLNEWKTLHQEFSEEDWNFAMEELKEYLKLAWIAYRQQHPEHNLPDTL
jgi:hypothetical protein